MSFLFSLSDTYSILRIAFFFKVIKFFDSVRRARIDHEINIIKMRPNHTFIYSSGGFRGNESSDFSKNSYFGICFLPDHI